MSTDVERFLSASSSLADPRNLPTGNGRTEERFNASGIHTVTLGLMLAQVAVIPMNTNGIQLIGYSGDEAMLRALHGRAEGGDLHIGGDLPFKAGQASGGFNRGGNVFIGGSMSFTGGTFTSYSSSGGGFTQMVVNGREVDLARAIEVVLVIPRSMNVRVREVVGAIGFTDDLDGSLDFSPEFQANVVARGVKSIAGEVRGSGRADIGHVAGDAEVEISGSGTVQFGSVAGRIAARISGSGNVGINGDTSQSMRARVSGSGSITHHGRILGGAELKVSGSGQIHTGTVGGTVDAKVSGMGSIYANGQTYQPRW